MFIMITMASIENADVYVAKSKKGCIIVVQRLYFQNAT